MIIKMNEGGGGNGNALRRNLPATKVIIMYMILCTYIYMICKIVINDYLVNDMNEIVIGCMYICLRFKKNCISKV